MFDRETASDSAGEMRVHALKVKTEMVTPVYQDKGEILPFEKAEIFAKTQGRIERVFVDEGQPVEKGSPLAQMERLPLELELMRQRSEYRAALARQELETERYNKARRDVEVRWTNIRLLETAVREARAIMDRTKLSYEGQTVIYRGGGLSREQFRQARTDLISREAEYQRARRELEMALVGFRDSDLQKRGVAVPASPEEKFRVLTDLNTGVERSELEVARAQSESARAALATTERLLNETLVRSPMRGVVAVRTKSAGEEVSQIGSATSSAALMTLVDIDRVYVELTVPESEVPKIERGQAVHFTVDVYGQTPFEGNVELISPILDKSHTFRVRALLDNSERKLRPGMFARDARIVTGEPVEKILIPETALIPREENRAWVFVLREGRAYRTEIETGAKHGDRIEISSGLQARAVIALEKLASLTDGGPARPEFEP